MFKTYQPIKRMSGKKVLGFFYRMSGNNVQYITFSSSVASIAKNLVAPATEEEYQRNRQQRYAKVALRNQQANS